MADENEELICECGHEQKQHFSLGCSKCDCLFFMTVDELANGGDYPAHWVQPGGQKDNG